MDYFARTAVQKGLNIQASIAPPLTIDGIWGPATQAALKKYQGLQRLPLTGQYDAATQALLGPYLSSKFVTLADLQAATVVLNTDINSILSVALTESQSSGFLPSGDCVILFERHKMYAALVQKYGTDKAVAWSRVYPNIVNPVQGGYVYGQGEWLRLNQAMTIDATCAQSSASWGLFQIMGFNYAACGFADVASYVSAMKTNEHLQLAAFVTFNQQYNKGVLLAALRAHNWSMYAAEYNGTGNVPSYTAQLSTNYANAAKYLS